MGRSPPSLSPFPFLLGAAVLLVLLSRPAAAWRHQHPKAQQNLHRAVTGAGGGSAAFLCSHTDYPSLCLLAARGVRGRPTPASLVQATIQVAIRQALRAKATATLSRGGRTRGTVGSLQTCRQTYDSAVADLQTSMRALKRGSLSDLKINLSAVITDVGTCDDAFAERGKPSPLGSSGAVIHKLASNGLALANMMNRRH